MIGLRNDIYWVVVTIFIKTQNLVMSESCNVFKTNNNVTVDLSICLFKNFTEPVSKWICMESCHNNPTVSLDKTDIFNEISWLYAALFCSVSLNEMTLSHLVEKSPKIILKCHAT